MEIDFDAPFSLDPDVLVATSGPLLLRCANLLRRLQRAALVDAGLSPTQNELLYLVAHIRSGHSLRSSDVAKALRLHPVPVARLMRVLEDKGFLRRRPHPSDKRANVLELTEAGRRKAEEARGLLAHAMHRFLEPLGHEEKGFRRLLTQLLRGGDPDRELPKTVRARRENRRRKRKP